MRLEHSLLSLGSSPLARGLPLAEAHDLVLDRIIPARAGFTLLARLAGNVKPGSSPLARGLPIHLPTGGRKPGIIPARAGFTSWTTGAITIARDHPRSRGVYTQGHASLPRRSGSSPLARGLRRQSFLRSLDGRIIPARAGFTLRVKMNEIMPYGSSPLARGLHRPVGQGRRRVRIIPARAGFTAAAYGDGRGQRDHPRSRGVYRSV